MASNRWQERERKFKLKRNIPPTFPTREFEGPKSFCDVSVQVARTDLECTNTHPREALDLHLRLLEMLQEKSGPVTQTSGLFWPHQSTTLQTTLGFWNCLNPPLSPMIALKAGGM